MRWTKILALVLGAVWFFPISCTTGILAVTKVIAKLDERTVADGDEVHDRFTVMATSGSENGAPQAFKLRELSQHKQNTEKLSFHLNQASGILYNESSNISYRVIEQSGAGQLIEVTEVFHDGDNTVLSRYMATPSSVTPIFSSMFYVGYLFAAVPYAFGFALILYIFGRVLRRRISM